MAETANGNFSTSLPFWGIVKFSDGTPGTCSTGGSNAAFTSFNVDIEDDYTVSGILNPFACAGCTILATVSVGGQVLLVKEGQNIGIAPFNGSLAVSSHSNTIHLEPGSHQVRLGVSADRVCFGYFQAAFDDIRIER